MSQLHEIVFFDDIIENFDRKKPIRPMPEGVKVVFAFKGSANIPTFKICHYKNEAFIWFRGTRVYSMNDIIIDFSITETEFLGGLVHKGYLDGARQALTLAMPYITGKDRIVTVGHSLGGACAALAAMILKFEMKWENVKSMTLACPGIVTQDIADKTKDFITTFVRRNDPIPRIFNTKRGVYSAANLFVSEENTDGKFISADRVPGRILIIDTENGETVIRKPVEDDFLIKPNNAVNFVAHCQRLYLRDINRIYGVTPNNATDHDDEIEQEDASDDGSGEDENGAVEEFQIRKSKKGVLATAAGITSSVLVAIFGLPGAIAGGAIAGGVYAFYRRKRSKNIIYAEENANGEEEEEEEEEEEAKCDETQEKKLDTNAE